MTILIVVLFLLSLTTSALLERRRRRLAFRLPHDWGGPGFTPDGEGGYIQCKRCGVCAVSPHFMRAIGSLAADGHYVLPLTLFGFPVVLHETVLFMTCLETGAYLLARDVMES